MPQLHQYTKNARAYEFIDNPQGEVWVCVYEVIEPTRPSGYKVKLLPIFNLDNRKWYMLGQAEEVENRNRHIKPVWPNLTDALDAYLTQLFDNFRIAITLQGEDDTRKRYDVKKVRNRLSMAVAVWERHRGFPNTGRPKPYSIGDEVTPVQ